MPQEKRSPMLERLRNLTDRELADELQKQRERLFTLRRDNVSRQLDNSAAIPQTRKMIARILTLQRERVLAVVRERERALAAEKERERTQAAEAEKERKRAQAAEKEKK